MIKVRHMPHMVCGMTQARDRHSDPGAALGVHEGGIPAEPGEAGLQLPGAAGA